MNDERKILVVLSGGMDSTVALYHAVQVVGANNVGAVTFNYGSKHNEREGACAELSARHLNITEHIQIDLAFMNEHFKSDLLQSGGEIPEGHYEDSNMVKTVVPFRNGIMLSVATGLAESKGYTEVMLGNHQGDHAVYPDCRKEFTDSFADAMRAGTYAGVQLVAPFVNVRKETIASVGHEMSVRWEHTFSCYKGGEAHCGVCGTCVERKEAFELAGIPDPTSYLS